MNAAFHLGRGKFEVRDVPIPDVPSGWALIRVERCGICGSDKHNLMKAVTEARVSGHEASGTVVKAPSDSDLQEGDGLYVHPCASCGKCEHCLRGDWNFCAQKKVMGGGTPGGFAEYVIAPAHTVVKKPESVDFSTAAMAEPVAVALHAASKVEVAGKGVLVFGAGGIGLLIVQVLRSKGAARVVAIDVRRRNLDAARELGASEAVNFNDETSFERISAPVVFDAVGRNSAVFRRAIELLDVGGSLVIVGAPETYEIDLMPVLVSELHILGSGWTTREDFLAAISLLESGAVKCEKVITATYPLCQIEEAFSALDDNIKIMIDCTK